MNLWLRLLKVVLLRLLRPYPLHPLGVSTLFFRVWPNDLDTNLHMNNGRYLTLMDLGRFDWIMRAGLLKHTWKKKWYPVLGACTIRFRRSLSLGQAFRLETRIAGWDAKWVYLEQRIYSRGKLCTLAYLRGIFTSPQGSIPMSEVMAALGIENLASPELPQGIQEWLRAEDALYQGALATDQSPQEK